MKCPLFRNLLHGKKNTKPAVKITNTTKHSPSAKSNTAKEVLESGGPDPVAGGTGNALSNADNIFDGGSRYLAELISDSENDKMCIIRPDRREAHNRIYSYIQNLLTESLRIQKATSKTASPELNDLIVRLRLAIAFLNENPNTCAADPEKFLKKFGLSGRS